MVKRQLHKSIIEVSDASTAGKTLAGGFHTHVLSDVPEDTDVFHVLRRQPPLPEAVGTKNFLYSVEADGSIRIISKR